MRNPLVTKAWMACLINVFLAPAFAEFTFFQIIAFEHPFELEIRTKYAMVITLKLYVIMPVYKPGCFHSV